MPGGKGGGALRVDPRDRARLAEAPVPLSRVVALLRPHRARILVVAAVTQLFGVLQTWLSTQVGQRVMHELRPTASVAART